MSTTTTTKILAHDMHGTPIYVGSRIKATGPNIREERRGHEADVVAPAMGSMAMSIAERENMPFVDLEGGGVAPASQLEVIATPEDPSACPEFDLSIIARDMHGAPIRVGDRVRLDGDEVMEEFRGDINVVVEPEEKAATMTSMLHEPILSLDDGMTCSAAAVVVIETADAEPVEA